MLKRTALAAAMVLAASSAADAVVLDFDAGFPSAAPGDSIVFGDFAFRVDATPGGEAGFGGRTVIPSVAGGVYFNANGAETTIAKVDGGAFDLLAFDFAQRPNDPGFRSASSIDVIGTLLGGGTVSFNTGGLAATLQAASVPSSFRDLVSVLFRPQQSVARTGTTDYEFVLDNVSLRSAVIPVPFGLPLLVTAFALAHAVRKRAPA